MKNFYVLVAFMGAIFFCKADWTSLSGPSAGYVNCIATYGDTVFAGTTDGMFISSNAGGTWTKSPIGFVQAGYTYRSVGAIVVKNNKIYAVASSGSNKSGIFVSSNYGSSWLALNTSFTNEASCLAIDSINIYVGTYQNGVYVSNDNGVSFKQSNTGMANTNLRGLIVKGTSVFAASEDRVYVSTNNGASWSISGTGIAQGTSMRTFGVSGNTLFAASNYYLFSSVDNGASWSQFPTSINTIVAMAVNSNKVYAVSGDKVYLSTNNTSFAQVTGTGLPTTNCLMNTIAIGKGGLFTGLIGSGTNGSAGVYKSTNAGTNWSMASTGLYSKVYTLFPHNTDLFVGTDAGAFISTNNGTSWAEVNTGLSRRDIRGIGMSGTKLIAGSGSTVFSSSNNGGSWIVPTSKNVGSVAGMAFTDAEIFAADQQSVKKSIDNGVNWTEVLPAGALYLSIAAKGSNVYVGKSNGLARSLNSGTNWTSITGTSFASSYIYAVATDGPNTYVAPSGMGVYYSADSGKTWIATSTGLSPGTSVYSLLISGSDVYAGSLSGEVFYSNNKGTSWVNISTGLAGNSLNVYALATDGTYLYAGTASGGVYRRLLSEISSLSAIPALPTNVSATATSDAQINVSWTYYATNIDKFIIEQSTSINGPWVKIGETASTVKTFSSTGLNAESAYLYRVFANNVSGNSAESNYAAATTLKTIVTNIEDLDQHKTLAIYPNPVLNKLYVNDASSQSSFTIFDVMGSIVAQGQLTNGSINVESLKSGMYQIQFSDANTSMASSKFIKQ